MRVGCPQRAAQDPWPTVAGAKVRQWRRRTFQAAFFTLFVLAPILDIFRFDLTTTHFVLFGQPWTLGIDALLRGEAGPREAAGNVILRGFLPVAGFVLLFGWVAWRWGRLYCGWLCPHFSVVELINGVMRRAIGRMSFWDRERLTPQRPDGRPAPVDPRWRWLIGPVAVGFAFLWAVVLLTYLLPPATIYAGLWHGDLTRNQALFIGVATALLSIEFLFARHLFCRFACAVGVFQSFVWMANRKAMVVHFDRAAARRCQGCANHCEDECPMRLKPRSIKRRMFTCTQCGRCLSACETVQAHRGQPSLLTWRRGRAALPESER
ncbi:MAG TPA: 4Fe-4S binding protein [Gammaproteobacteria bacterium]|nr:4Fe-4S binding protein [Gammaproteobacteria bacterium]